jgi:hypothetical protein
MPVGSDGVRRLDPDADAQAFLGTAKERETVEVALVLVAVVRC